MGADEEEAAARPAAAAGAGARPSGGGSGAGGGGGGGGGAGASRIPLPSRPAPAPAFRRSVSMRLRGEKPVGPGAGPGAGPPPPYLRRSQQQLAGGGRAAAARPGGGGGGDSTFGWNGGGGLLAGRLRSLSLSGGGFPHGPAPSPEPRRRGPRPGEEAEDGVAADEDEDTFPDDDASSLQSFGSACSTMSCDHAYFARNGTTFSGRRMKYVVHCSPHAGEAAEYLTPTQRAARQVRRLRLLLQQAQSDLALKDQDIFRLTKEVVELRLFKASLSPSGGDRADGSAPAAPPDEHQLAVAPGSPPRSPLHSPDAAADSSGDAVSAAPAGPGPGPGPGPATAAAAVEKTSSPSLADSGHFEDMASSPELLLGPGRERERERERELELERELAERERLWEARLQQMHSDGQQLKERTNDRVEALLQRLSDANAKHMELRGECERAQDRARQLEREAESLRRAAQEQEERHQSMYLKMYMKGQEAARFEHADQVLEFAHKAPGRVSVPELLQQLQVTESELENVKGSEARPEGARKSALLSAREALSLWLLGTRKAMYRRIVESRAKKGELDPEITLQFLKSAIYYFLTDKENHQGHLSAIESILGYTENEKINIDKAYRMYARK